MANNEELNNELLVAAGDCSLQEVQRLLDAGADAAYVHDPPGVWGSCSRKSPIHAAIDGRPRHGDSEGDYEGKYANWKSVLKLLIGAKADVNATRADYDWRGCGSTRSAFQLVLRAAMEDVELLELFLSAGADANTKQVRNVHSMRTDGQAVSYVLHSAVQRGDLEVARALLDAGAEVDALSTSHFDNERGYNEHTEETALHQACDKGDLAMVSLLLARGADVNSTRELLEQVHLDVTSPSDDPRDDEFVPSVECVPVRETALHMALRREDSDLATLLVCAGADAACDRVRGEEQTPCTELCNGNETLIKALSAEWTPDTHKFFPAKVRESVEAALMIARRQKWPLPENVLFSICALAASGPSGASAA